MNKDTTNQFSYDVASNEIGRNNLIQYLLLMFEQKPEMRSKALSISSFFANEFSKELTHPDFQYLISAIYASRLIGLTQNGVTLDGVLYPSVRAEGRGINVALSKECADSKLRLHAVLQCRVYKKNNRMFVNNEKFTVVEDGRGDFQLEPIMNPDENIPRETILQHLNR